MNLPPHKMEGKRELRTQKKIWTDVAEAEERVKLIRELIKLRVGFEDLEHFHLGQAMKYKSTNFRGKNGEDLASNVIVEQMRLKLKDEEYYLKERDMDRQEKRGKIEEEMGRNTRRYKARIETLRNVAWAAKLKIRKKNKKKVKDLNYKYREKIEKKKKPIPKGLEEFEELSFMREDKFEEIEQPNREVLVLSEGLILSEDERAVLRLHTKFSVIDDLQKGEYEFEMEIAYS